MKSHSRKNDSDHDSYSSSSHDEFSASSSYHDPSANDLSMLQAAALLAADCLGTGLLALPHAIKVLGNIAGLGFLVLNLPINLYAGTILSHTAGHVEEKQRLENLSIADDEDKEQQNSRTSNGGVEAANGEEGLALLKRQGNYSSVAPTENQPSVINVSSVETPEKMPDDEDSTHHNHHRHHDTATFDFIGITQVLFHQRRATQIVMVIYYINIFLTLGDYILVMSHAVTALIGEDIICLPEAGIIASTLMFCVSQIRSMARLGRAATIVSLGALAIVIVQCLIAGNQQSDDAVAAVTYEDSPLRRIQQTQSSPVSFMRKCSAIASIGFAVGSQKLFLNIRHEMKNRNEGPKSLAIALSSYGSVYVAICVLAGPDPPSFLFDAIAPGGWNRRIAGFLLWVHVVVSYSINSQAICSSIDRIFFHRVKLWGLDHKDEVRWLILTLMLAVSSYIVANAVPFFKDLVALIGALTSVPLTLLIPAIYHRQRLRIPLWLPTKDSIASYSLVIFSLAFLFAGLYGSLGSIEMDWKAHPYPFACH